MTAVSFVFFEDANYCLNLCCEVKHLSWKEINPLKTGDLLTGNMANSEDPDKMQHFNKVCTVEDKIDLLEKN